MEASTQFTPEEIKIRKRWLTWAVIIPFSIMSLIFFYKIGGEWRNLLNNNSFPALLALIPILCLVCLIPIGYGYFFYRCAYQKTDINLLMFSISMVIISGLKDIPTISINAETTYLEILWIIASFGWSAWVLYVSIPMFRLNKKKKMESCPEYKKAASTFQAASSTEELKEMFQTLTYSLDSRRVKKSISSAYEIRKSQLI